jgi:hypothetical protein
MRLHALLAWRQARGGCTHLPASHEPIEHSSAFAHMIARWPQPDVGSQNDSKHDGAAGHTTGVVSHLPVVELHAVCSHLFADAGHETGFVSPRPVVGLHEAGAHSVEAAHAAAESVSTSSHVLDVLVWPEHCKLLSSLSSLLSSLQPFTCRGAARCQ